jgi:putative DNA primase/helicase
MSSSLKKMVADDYLKIVNDLNVEPKTNDNILKELVNSVNKVDFKILAFPEITDLTNRLAEVLDILKIGKDENLEMEVEMLEKKLLNFKLNKNHFLVLCIEQLLKLAIENDWGLCKKDGVIYLYNGSYWSEISKEGFQHFLGNIALKMGVEKFKSKIYTFKDELHKQFLADAYLETPIINRNKVLINLLNGTYEISPEGKYLREFRREDFITHQLPFDFNPDADAPIFMKYLNEVLPDIDKQKVLAEFMGFIFTKGLKLENALVLYGTGANGKSVFFEVLNALLGSENISNFAIESLTTDNNYSRAKISNKLVNYASELNGRIDANTFKQLVSNEPIQARLPYGEPFTIKDYAKLIFNCNELPKDTEHTHAYFRRFLIIGFDITIPEEKQDKKLHTKIIDNEMSGVFNWILEGLDRLLHQGKFTTCKAIENARSDYEKMTDSVMLFVEELGYKKDLSIYTPIKFLYEEYKIFCLDDGFRPVNKTNFMKRLSHHKIYVKRIDIGNVAYLKKEDYKF